MSGTSDSVGSSGSQLPDVESEVERLGPVREGNKFVCILYRCQNIEFDFPYLEENVIAKGLNYGRPILIRCPRTKPATRKPAIDEGRNPEVPQYRTQVSACT